MNTSLKIQKYTSSAAPDKWYEYAEELKDSSEVLWEHSKNNLDVIYDSKTKTVNKQPGVSRTYMFIIGICLENLFKGILIAENPALVTNGKIDNSISSGHNICGLSTKVKLVKFTNDEKKLLRILSDAVPYWGKYPIPKNFEQIKQQTIMTPKIRNTFLNLYKKLERAIYNTTKFGWKGSNGVSMSEWFVSTLENLPENREKITFDQLCKLRRKKQKST